MLHIFFSLQTLLQYKGLMQIFLGFVYFFAALPHLATVTPIQAILVLPMFRALFAKPSPVIWAALA